MDIGGGKSSYLLSNITQVHLEKEPADFRKMHFIIYGYRISVKPMIEI